MTLQNLQKPPSKASAKRERTKVREATYRANCRLVDRRDGHKCRVCGSRENLHTHHIRFRSQGRSDETSNLVRICNSCHSDVHAYRLTITGNADSALIIERAPA